MRNRNLKKFWIFGFAIVLSFSLILMTQKTAHAEYENDASNCNSTRIFFNRAMCQTYFDNYDPCSALNPAGDDDYVAGCPSAVVSFTWPTGYPSIGWDTAAQFERFVTGGINGCDFPRYALPPANPMSCNLTQLLSAVGNAMIVETMLGNNLSGCTGAASGCAQAGIIKARADLVAWSSIVNSYETASRITWKQSIAWNSPSLVNCNAGAGMLGANPGRSDTLGIAQGFTIDTDTYCNTSPSLADYIVFNNPDGSFFRISRTCGNITGTASPLTLISPDRFLITPDSFAKLTNNIDAAENEIPTKVHFFATATASPPSPRSVNNITLTIKYTLEKYGVPITPFGPGTVTVHVPNVPKSSAFFSTPDVNYALPPGLVAGDKLCETTIADPGSGTLDRAGNVITSAGPSPPVKKCDTVVNKPYLRTYGGDVIAGRRNCPAWGVDTSPNIKAYTRGINGSGSQLGVLALGGVTGGSGSLGNDPSNPFNSAQLSSNFPNPPFPKFAGLSFANDKGTGGEPNPQVPPGTFNEDHCPADFFGFYTQQGALPPLVTPPSNNIDLQSVTTGIYYYKPSTSPFSLGKVLSNAVGLGDVPANPWTKIVVIVNGKDVYIDKNIQYFQSSNGRKNWQIVNGKSLDYHMESFMLIVNGGNIYIDKSVTNLAGTYVAQPVAPFPTGGAIYTCSDNRKAEPANVYKPPGGDLNLISDCGTQLTVDGALVANNVIWQRTYGSLRDSKGASEYPAGAIQTCYNAMSPTCAAEVTDFTPATYMTVPALPSTTVDTPLDYLNTLEPIF